MLASIGSFVRDMPVMAKISTNAEENTVPAREPIRNGRPKCFHAMRNSGTFIMMDIIPTGKPVKWLMIIEIPVTPPETMLFGYMKNWKPTAYMAEPMKITKYLMTRLNASFCVKLLIVAIAASILNH